MTSKCYGNPLAWGGKQQHPPEAQAQGGGEVAGWVLEDTFVNAKFWTADTPPQGWTPVYYTAPPSVPVGVEGLLADLETIWHSVSDDKETNAAYQRLKAALAQQPAACAHSWNDYGTVNRAWCSRCNAVAVIGHEDRPYGVLSVTDDGEYRTNPIQQPAAVDEATARRILTQCLEDDPGDAWPPARQGDLRVKALQNAINSALTAQQGGES